MRMDAKLVHTVGRKRCGYKKPGGGDKAEATIGKRHRTKDNDVEMIRGNVEERKATPGTRREARGQGMYNGKRI